MKIRHLLNAIKYIASKKEQIWVEKPPKIQRERERQRESHSKVGLYFLNRWREFKLLARNVNHNETMCKVQV
jgi:hypothetical protein